MRPLSYIGITGFMSRQEVYDVCSALPGNSERLTMVGVLVSNKTVRGLPNRQTRRYPTEAHVGSIFASNRHALNLLHFNTNEPETLLEDMCLAQELAGPNCDGFQLNIAWPDKSVLRKYKTHTTFARKIIVLQCGRHALDLAEGDPAVLASMVRQYDGLIDYVLIDPSGGTGLKFDQNFALRCVGEIATNTPNLGIGVAGGLSAHNLEEQLGSLLRHYPVSIDVESGVRDPHDNLDIDAAQQYLQTADKLFTRYRR